MALRGCRHLRRAQGVIRCDLARNGEVPLYSTAFKANICSTCGRTEFYCEPYEEVCAWLDVTPTAIGEKSCFAKSRRKTASKKAK
jgi:squalene cyclase